MTTPDITRISHLVHEKYSPNLHRFLEKEQRTWKEIRAFLTNDDKRIIIGYAYDGDIMGLFLTDILCSYGRGHKSYCYPGYVTKTTLIPDFWADYERLGRCVVDPEHNTSFLNAETRYVVSPDEKTRECRWCGTVQRQTIREEVVIHKGWEVVKP